MKESLGRIEFVTLLVAGGPTGGTVTLPVPREVSAALGSRGRVEVRGTVDGQQLRAAALPDGAGGHVIHVSRQLLSGAGAGQRVKVVLERIEQEAPVEAPADLQKALGKNVQAKAAWEKFPPPHRRAWVEYLAQTKKQDVRERRIAEAVQRIALGKTP
jgi:hypothetical protein